ncbi:MAG: TonB-dependent receptor plug domain-containing protein [Bacteroidales bacterium]|nr:TonB-dependent receptor plug domain-containing protein [Bacteroidales bacterium]
MEKNSYEPVPYATCFDTISKTGTVSDETGHFSMLLPKGNVHLKISYTGYFHSYIEFYLNSDTTLIFFIEPVKLDEVTIIAKEEPVHIQTLSDKTYIPVKKINNLPSFVGQPDILKSLSFIPGVSNGKEGKSALYVRGGSKDQNLFLMDDAVIYNPYHAAGFLTGINTDIVKSIDFYKGGFPARYGGRSSSILDIQLKEGHKNRWHGKATLGLVSSGFVVEGPVKKEKTSMILAFRSSYYDLINLESKRNFKEAEKIPLSINSNTFIETFNFTFFDINFKINHQVNKKNKICFNFYSGNDYQFDGNIICQDGYQARYDKSDFNIQTYSVSLGHNLYLLSGKLIKTSISFNQYSGNFYEYDHTIQKDEDLIYDKSSTNWLDDLTVKSQVIIDYNNRHSIRAGLQNSLYYYQPGKMKMIKEDLIASAKFDTIYEYRGENRLNDLSFFIEDEIKLTTAIQVNIGLRNSAVFTSEKAYFNIEPRISFRQLLGENFSYKASYTLMHQYLHVLTDYYYGFEREVWVGTTGNLAPAYAHQATIGIFGLENKTGIEFGIEPFYKKMGNLIYYRPPVLDEKIYDNWENIIAKKGTGEAYGIEFFVQKRTEKFIGSVAYTLSWNYRQFEQLNNGRKFPFLYDTRHNLNIIMQYDLSKMYSASINFTLNSGARVTLPEAYIAPGSFFPDYTVYSSLNNRSLPLYHRLDLMTQKHWKSKRGLIQHFNVNIFNVYAHKNPVYIYISNGKVYKKSFFSIIPTISYGIEF